VRSWFPKKGTLISWGYSWDMMGYTRLWGYDRIMIWDIFDITSFRHEQGFDGVQMGDSQSTSSSLTICCSKIKHGDRCSSLDMVDITSILHLQTSGTIPPIPCHSLRHPQGVSVLMMRDVLRCVPEILG
jgi:hypothetical protein